MEDKSPDPLIDHQSSDPMIDIRCPITGMIMKDPVVAQDNNIYERDAIEDWFKENNTSPKTRQNISKNVTSVLAIKNYIEEYIREHPELEDEVYIPIMSHGRYKKEIKSIIINEKWDELRQYIGFDYVLCDTTEIREKLFGKCTNKILKYVIDNTIDLDSKRDNGARMIHAICTYSTSEIIKYIIDKGVDIESPTTNSVKRKPIENILLHQNIDTIIEVCKYFNNTKINMEQLKKLHDNENIKTFKEYYRLLRHFKKNNMIE